MPDEQPTPEQAIAPTRTRANYVGAPQIFHLHNACALIDRAFPEAYGCYLVGSSIVKRDFRDVDVRLIMADADFLAIFPGSNLTKIGHASFNARWSLICCSISGWLSQVSGLPVDFQIQPRTQANELYPTKGGHERQGLGWFYAPAKSEGDGQ